MPDLHGYILREAENIIEQRLGEFPAVVLLGPRQVGKTTLARRLAARRPDSALYLDLERPFDQRRLDDADAFLRAQSGKLVILDEIHRKPELFAALRGVIDDRRVAGDRTGCFLLLGSASLDLMRQASESLAGRIYALELAPITAIEAHAAHIALDDLWVRGGFPDSLLAAGDEQSLVWRDAFIRTYLDRDVPMFAPRSSAEAVHRLWTMLAHLQGQLLEVGSIANGLNVSARTVQRYIDLLCDLLLVRSLQPWSQNVGKRLIKAPKIYLRDSGLAHALLGLSTLSSILGHPVVGGSWEAFVIENLCAAAGDRYRPYYYRTSHGAEVDLVLERGGRPLIVVEIKRSPSAALSRGFYSSLEVLQPEIALYVHSGNDDWEMKHSVTARSLTSAMSYLASL